MARLRRVLASLGRGLAVAASLGVLWLLAVWPPPIWYRSHWPAETAFMEMRGGTDRRYTPVPLDSMAAGISKAVTIGEDDDFWNHRGIDWKALRQALGYPRSTFSWSSARDREALIPLLRRAWAKRDALRGASTITQQLAKNLYLSPSRNPARKIKEAVTAYRLEGALGKERILELYLNVVELGDELWGVEAASQKYFKRSANRLSSEQSAALAATLPFPLTSNPSRRPGRMRWRQQLILERMRGGGTPVPRVETEIVPPVAAPPDTALNIPDPLIPPALESLPPPAPSLADSADQ